MNSSVCYKVRHKATGLYYKPGKRNLSKIGKIYPDKKTCLSYFPENRTTVIVDNGGRDLRVTRDDFEFVAFKLEPLD